MFKPVVLLVVCLFTASCSSIPSVQKKQSLADYLDSINFSGSVLVSRDNEIIHSAGYGFANKELKVPNTPNTMFYIASLSKQFTFVAIMQLQEQGLLNIHDPIERHLPEFPNSSKITIKQLLNHSAGLPDFTDSWDEIKQSDLSVQDLIGRFKDKELDFEPGSSVEYSSSGYILAGKIIEKVSGMAYEDYVESQIFKPIGMSQSSYGYSTKNALNQAIG